MPRTAGKKGKNKGGARNRSPEKKYQRLSHPQKLICWNYYQYIATNGEYGFDPDKAGSITHQRTSQYLIDQGSYSWFRHQAKSMVTLAQQFVALQKEIPNPGPIPKKEVNFTEQATEDTPATPNQPESPTMKSFSSPPRAAARSPMNNSMDVRSMEGLERLNENALPAPTSFGAYTEFDFTSRTSIDKILIRMILHNGVTNQDVQFSWVNARNLCMRVAWPDWFQNAEQMAAFAGVDDNGNYIFPPSHAAVMDTCRRNQELVEEDGRVWDEGFLTFERDMNQEQVFFELLTVNHPSRGTTVTVLQAHAEVLPNQPSVATSNRVGVSRTRTVDIGGGPRPSNPGTTRTGDQAGHAGKTDKSRQKKN